MTIKKKLSPALLCPHFFLSSLNSKIVRCLLIISFVLSMNSCKKETSAELTSTIPEAELTKINLQKFLQATNNSDLGFLKDKFQSGIKGERLMSIGNISNIGGSIDVYTDTITQIRSKSGTSYVFRMPLTSPHSISFRNLTIEVEGEKTTSFIATYTPTQDWISARKNSKTIPFDGTIAFNRIDLEKTTLREALVSMQVSAGERIMSVDNRTMTVDICTTYIIYTYTAYGCSSGNHMPGDMNCVWNWENSSVPPGESRAGYAVSSQSFTACESIDGYAGPPSGGGGGGGSSPTPPPGYNPCNGTPPNVSVKFERGTRLAVLPPTPCDPPTMPEGSDPSVSSNAQYLFNILSISDETRRNYINSHSMAANDLVAFIATNGNTSENREFLGWAISYLAMNPNTTNFDIVKNQFLEKKEGSDFGFNAEYWNDPNHSFPAQQLPSFQAYNNAFPKKNGGYMPAPEVFQLIGGQLNTSHIANPGLYSNACAVRVSRALNYSGVVIPSISGQTEKGADNKNYFLSAANLNAWMKKTFTTYTTFTGAQGGKNGRNFPALLKDKKGIFIMIPNYPAYFASGHADVWDGTICNGGCYFNIERDLPENRKLNVAFINIWELN